MQRKWDTIGNEKPLCVCVKVRVGRVRSGVGEYGDWPTGLGVIKEGLEYRRNMPLMLRISRLLYPKSLSYHSMYMYEQCSR